MSANCALVRLSIPAATLAEVSVVVVAAADLYAYAIASRPNGIQANVLTDVSVVVVVALDEPGLLEERAISTIPAILVPLMSHAVLDAEV
jgi:hypothetical protein